MPIIDALVERDTPTANLSWLPWFDAFLGGHNGTHVNRFFCVKYTNLGDTNQYILLLCEVTPSALIEGASK